jgi:hypothetical protein
MGRRRGAIVALLLCTAFAGCAFRPPGSGPETPASAQGRAAGLASDRAAQKRVIEFGWGEPDAAFMRRHLDQMERLPFDGCVFHVAYARPGGGQGLFVWEAWGRRAFTAEELEASLGDLWATSFRRFTHNFLRFNVTPGDLDWFDDFGAVLSNARLAARVAREGNARGILFDIEQYEEPIFTYAKQRHAGTRSWEAYAAQARQRGREVMAAFQDGYPGLTVFLTWGYSGPWREMLHLRKPLPEVEYGLLAPFLDGLVDAAGEGVRLVDGYEISYYHRKDVESFSRAARVMREEVLPIVGDPAKYRRLLSVGFALWMDFDSPRLGWDGSDGSRNYYTPEDFERSLRTALAAADEYVWIYTEKPRWWSAGGGPIGIPAGYLEAIRRAREAANR